MSKTCKFWRWVSISITALSLTTPTVSRVFFIFFLRTNTPFPGHANRVSVAALFHLCHPNSLEPFPLHPFGVAHQTSLRSGSTMMSYANSPEGGGSPNQSDGDSSHHNAVQAFPHRQNHRFSAASCPRRQNSGNQSDLCKYDPQPNPQFSCSRRLALSPDPSALICADRTDGVQGSRRTACTAASHHRKRNSGLPCLLRAFPAAVARRWSVPVE